MMPSAALRPSAMAVTTRSEPRTASPPAKIFGLLVWNALALLRGHDAPLAVQIHAVFRQPVHLVRTETKRHDHGVCFQHMLGAFDDFRTTAAIGIRRTQFSTCHSYAAGFTGTVDFDAERLQVEQKFHALFARIFTSRLEPGMLTSSRR